jgi:hypothetical protein
VLRAIDREQNSLHAFPFDPLIIPELSTLR